MAIRAVKKVNINGKAISNLKAYKAKNPKAVIFDSKFEWECFVLLRKERFNFSFHPEQRELIPKFQTLALSGAKGAREICS